MTMNEQDEQDRAAWLLDKAADFRPPIQATVEFAVDAARLATTLGGTTDEIWAAQVVNLAQALKLDLDDRGQFAAACAITEMSLRLAGIKD